VSTEASRACRSLDAYSIGPKLRALRQQKGLTLSRLAAETGLSTVLLSKLETDRMIPTLPTLATISGVFGVGLSFFFAEPTRHRVSITRKANLVEHERAMGALKSTPLKRCRRIRTQLLFSLRLSLSE
jgi:transcriptional regulator with XRE-family HTH domain